MINTSKIIILLGKISKWKWNIKEDIYKLLLYGCKNIKSISKICSEINNIYIIFKILLKCKGKYNKYQAWKSSGTDEIITFNSSTTLSFSAFCKISLSIICNIL